MLPVIVGLTGALIFGAADFLGGIASKRISAMRVTAIGAAAGFFLLLLSTTFIKGTWSVEALILGGLTGVTGALAISFLYACLAIGPMSILSPTTAVVSALVPMLAGVLRGEQLRPIAYLALALALIAVILVGFVPEKGAVRPSLKALGMAVAAGALIGAFLIIIDLTQHDSGMVPLVANRAVNALVMFAVIGGLALFARRRRASASGLPAIADRGTVSGSSITSGGWRPGFLLAICCGIIDATGNIFVLIGLRIGELTIQSVLTALYPAGTIILAAIVLKERIAPVQLVGLVLAIVAASMLALA